MTNAHQVTKGVAQGRADKEIVSIRARTTALLHLTNGCCGRDILRFSCQSSLCCGLHRWGIFK